MTLDDKAEYIRCTVGDGEVLAQLAEEAAELTKAALKLRRAMSDSNPTPVDYKTAYRALIEEMADVRVCCDVLFDTTPTALVDTYKFKLNRWFERLTEHEM